MGAHLYTNGAWTDSGRIYRNSLNLYNKGTTTVYDAFLSDIDKWLIDAGGVSKSIKIPCDSGTHYTISIPDNVSVFRIYESSNAAIEPTNSGVDVSRIIRSANIHEYTFTTLSNTKVIIFQATGAELDIWFNNLMFNLGGIAFPYEPYNVVDWYINTGHGYSSGAWD